MKAFLYALSLGTLDMTELALIAGLGLLLGGLVANGRARRGLEREVRRLGSELETLGRSHGEEVAELEQRRKKLAPRDAKARNQRLAGLLRALLEYTRAASGNGRQGASRELAQHEERP